MCLQCFIHKNNQNGCIQCEKVQTRKSTNDDFDDFDQNQLFDDFDENQLFDEWNEQDSTSQNDSKQTDMDTMNSIYDDDTEEGDSEDENPTDNNQSVYKVQWLSDIKDDAAEFSSDHTYAHTKSMLSIFGVTFGLKQV
jgi:hypothetical protein